APRGRGTLSLQAALCSYDIICFAWPIVSSLNTSHRPSFGLRSAVKARVGARQSSPLPPHVWPSGRDSPEKVSPNAIQRRPVPSSHIVPRSVPPTAWVLMVELTEFGPVSHAIGHAGPALQAAELNWTGVSPA